MLPNILWRRLIIAAGLLLFFALALDTALSKAPTVDESVHVFLGVTLWQSDNLRLQSIPPLGNWLVGSLLLTEDKLPDVTRLDGWRTGDQTNLSNELIWQSGLNVPRVFLLARLPIVLLGTLLASALVRWSGELMGRSSQKLVLLLFVFSPNLIASSSLATTDFTATATYLASVYTLWRYWRLRSVGRWLLAAVCLGLALAAKMTSLLLLPVTLLLCYSHWRRGRPWWLPGVTWLSLLPLAGLVIWSLYHFDFGAVTGMPYPSPGSTYINSLSQLGGYVEARRQAYLFGETSGEGWWHYFLVAFLIKTPVTTLLLLGWAVTSIIRQARWRQTMYLWFPAASLFAVASYSRLNIGYRHILPLLPLALLLATGVALEWLKRPNFRLLLLVLLAWYTVSGIRQHPDHLAYFNELVGGSAQGYRYLGDSNLDWGQDLELLADFVRRAGDRTVYHSYFGASDPAYYGLPPGLSFSDEGDPLDFAPANPAPGLYAISVSHVQGMVLLRPDTFDWFRRQKPVDRLGYSIFIYEVPAAASGDWVAHCLDPTPALEDQAYVARLVNQEQLRNVYFDCRKSWVFPNQANPGWYILPPERTGPVGRLFANTLTLVFADSSNPYAPSYEVYYWDGQHNLDQWLELADGRAALPDGNPVELPLIVGETAQLYGHRLEGADWLTLWRVQEATDIPLSVAAHLYGDDTNPIIADGLGYTSIQWRPGDVFLQWYSVDPTTPIRHLETGLYNYLTGDRLPVSGDGHAGTFIRLALPD